MWGRLGGRAALGCLPFFVFFAAATTVNYNLLKNQTGESDTQKLLTLSAISAFFIALGLFTFWGLARGHGRGDTSLREMLRRARVGQPPDDKKPMIATGRVRALGSPLNAPISGRACVAYFYRMFHRYPRGSSSDIVTSYWGYGSRPFALDSGVSRARVFAVPSMMNLKGEVRSGTEDIERARSWVRAARFEPVNQNFVAELSSTLTFVKEMFTDEDGEARRDWKLQDTVDDPAALILEETILPVDAEASAYGTWSTQRAAMVAGDGTLGSLGLSVVLGPPEQLSRVAGTPRSMGTYLLSGTVLTAMGVGLFYFFRYVIESQ